MSLLRQSHTVVCDHNRIIDFGLAQASKSNGARSPAVVGVFEGVRQQLVDDESRRHCNVDRNRRVIHFEVEADSIDRIGVHDGRSDLTEIMS